ARTSGTRAAAGRAEGRAWRTARRCRTTLAIAGAARATTHVSAGTNVQLRADRLASRRMVPIDPSERAHRQRRDPHSRDLATQHLCQTPCWMSIIRAYAAPTARSPAVRLASPQGHG